MTAACTASGLAARSDWRRRPAACGPATPSCSNRSPAFPPPAELWVELLRDGDGGARPADGDTVDVHYACLFGSSGCCVDASRSRNFRAREPLRVTLGSGDVVAGMDRGLRCLTLGALARLHVPARLAYGDVRAGPVPPGTSLVFEVELLRLNDRTAAALPVQLLRRLLVLPACEEPLGDGRAVAVVAHPAAARAEQRTDDELGAASGDSDGDVDADGAPAARALARCPPPRWLSRLVSSAPLPTAETCSFFRAFGGLRGVPAVRRAAEVADGAGLIAGALPIRHAPYGTAWDSETPLVLTGDRPNWPPSAWGWGWLSRELGDSVVTCKQRAPLFDDDAPASTLVAECSLRECIRYARWTEDADGAESAAHTPILYMNGWDVFEAHPGLWDARVDALPGTIDNLTAPTHAELHAQFGLGDPTPRVRQLCKLFVGPRGAVTRLHVDNHHAHAWLSQLRGHKLYVLCAPADAHLVDPRGEHDSANSPANSPAKSARTAEGRLDPLDAAALEKAQREGARVYATILRPGETIIVPDGWWHYAASLTPTATLMCNFWDRATLSGLHGYFANSVAKTFDSARRGTSAAVAGAAEGSATETFGSPVAYRVVHKPFVYVRAAPSMDAPMLGTATHGQVRPPRSGRVSGSAV